MTDEKLSMKKIYITTGIGFATTASAMLAALYLLTDSVKVILYGFIFMLILIAWIAIFILLVRKRLTAFSSAICRTLDNMMNDNIEPQQNNEEETLFIKINYRLIRLFEVMQENRRRVAEEKETLQGLISDISHQVKMPLANLKMVNSTLLEQNMPENKQQEFLRAVAGQLDKLDFLMQAMIKTSRLETGVITLTKKDCSVYETLAAALGGIFLLLKIRVFM